jgi:GH15 family glucan-1,4-alpha-glucosidase
MARAVTLGNGTVLVGLDYRGQVRDLYFPHVGHSNHVSGASGSFLHRIGVYIDEQLVWFDDPSWKITVNSDDDAPVGIVHAVNEKLQVTLVSTDVVHNEDNIFLRSFLLRNDAQGEREIKVFFAQQFRIDESRRGDTGFYDPRVGALIHYKGHTTILVNAFHKDTQFTDYNIGLFGIEGKEGTYHDANDGVLERNPVEHGSVDSVIGLTVTLAGEAETTLSYWIACGKTIDDVHDLNALVLHKSPEALILTTTKYWNAWMSKNNRDLNILAPELQKLYRRSLATIRVHSDNGGAIIASSDTGMLHHGRDTYSYVWPRDASLIANALDKVGYSDVAERYFTFITSKIDRKGYLHHKYRADGVLGSSWHPWMIDGRPGLPIQEDETALTLTMLWQHYLITKDIEYLESKYDSFVEPAADFMVDYFEPAYGLPSASYDLWEEKYGTSTYTASAVYAALASATECALLLGKEERARTYSVIAERIQAGILEHLYSEEIKMFVKHIKIVDNEIVAVDTTIDMSSFFGPIFFGVVDISDERVKKSFATIEHTLRVDAASAGYVRYQNDNYYTMHETGSPNPWVITTLWVAQYHIMKAKKIADLKPAYELLEWTCSHASEGGVLSEQMHPETREHLSTAPLIWSHAEFVATADAYILKHQELSGA